MKAWSSGRSRPRGPPRQLNVTRSRRAAFTLFEPAELVTPAEEAVPPTERAARSGCTQM